METFLCSKIEFWSVNMKKKWIRLCRIIIITLIISFQVIGSTETIENTSVNELLYAPKYEFRAAWIATVYNLDWPSKTGLGIKEQKEEYISLLDSLKGTGINAVIVQIRPSGDALYASKYAPWSEYLTGIQGKDPGYNPLEFMIEETHKRGMEFHAWMNPFRITASGLDQTKLDQDNIGYLHPDWLIAYDNKWMLNPGIPQVREYIIDIVAEIILEYPIDGIHFDDYFYPYLNIKEGPFPDDQTYEHYNTKKVSKEEWRRNNINQLINGISQVIKLNRPKIKFGISPFGIWCNKSSNKNGSDTQAGVSSYETLYADTRYWIEEGWIDYIAPQLYWKFDYDRVPYYTILDWWEKELLNKNTHLYIGQAAYKLKEDESWTVKDIINQLTYNRTKEVVKGSIFFSSKSLQENIKGVSSGIKSNFYTYKAIIPPMPWLPGRVPSRPEQIKLKEKEDYVKLSWVDKSPEDTDYYIIYKFEEGIDNINDPRNILDIIKNENMKSIKKEYIDHLGYDKKTAYKITSMSKSKGESLASELIKIK